MKTTTIESIVTDMGNGDSFCNNCQEKLTRIIDEWTSNLKAKDRYICPKCKYKLYRGGTFISPGGSDF